MHEPRKKMTEIREAQGKSIERMAQLCKCSEELLRIVELEGAVTHPHIAARIAAAYGLDLDGYNEIVPKEHKATKLPKPQPKPAGRFVI